MKPSQPVFKLMGRGVALVSGRPRVTAVAPTLLMIFSLALLVSSCGDKGPGPNDKKLSSLLVTPSDTVYLETGQTQKFTVEGRDQNDNPMGLDSVFWSLHGQNIGMLSPDTGDTTILATSDTGSAYVVATCNSISDSTLVIVSKPQVSVTVSPADSVRLEVGDQQVFTAVVRDQYGDEIPTALILWTLHGALIGALDPDTGHVTSLLVSDTGTAYVVATSDSRSDSVVVKAVQTITSIIVSPDSIELEVGDNQVFAAEGRSATGLPIDLEHVSWSLTNNIGRIAPADSSTTTLSTTDIGTAFVVATYGSLRDSAFVRVRTASPFSVLTDSIIVGYIGLFHGPYDTIGIVIDSGNAAEGIWSLRAEFYIRSNGWAGWYIEEGGVGGNETRDLSHFLLNGHLRFSVMTTVELEIGIRSDNISPGDEQSKVCLLQYEIPADGTWHDVAIPLFDFWMLEWQPPTQFRLDFSKMEVYFIASVGPCTEGVAVGTYWIDNVRWTKD